MDFYVFLPVLVAAAYGQNLTCKDDEFACSDGSECILAWRFCDGFRNCPDGSDLPAFRDNTIAYEPNVTFCQGKSAMGYICVLPDELVPQKDKLCQSDSTCPTGAYACLVGSRCLDAENFCDQREDCRDGSDELNVPAGVEPILEGRVCTSKSSPMSQHSCLQPSEYVCDGISFCLNDVDECLCGANQKYFLDEKCFRCLSNPGFIIPITSVCNGVVDCPDFSDECLCAESTRPLICHQLIIDGMLQASGPSCPSSYNETEIPVTASMVCDNIADCKDGQDETGCRKRGQFLLSNLTEILPQPQRKGNNYTCPYAYQEYANGCNGIPECNFYFSEECDCETNATFCEYFLTSNARFVPLCLRNNQTRMVSVASLCDGVAFCDNLGDERGCFSRFYCSQDEPLPNIAPEKICDRQDDCPDGSDERNCSHFYCNDAGSLSYISDEAICDGVQDCEAGSDECQQGCINSAFSDEESMIANKAVLAVAWIISLAAVSGCAAVFGLTARSIITKSGKKNSSKLTTRVEISNRLILSLSLSDFLVGVYTLAVCIKATMLNKDYCLVDREWRSSGACSALGVLLVIGSEQSVLTMVLIAVHRFQSVLRPFAEPNMRYALVAISTTWVISVLLGIIPLFPQLEDYFVSSIAFTENPIFKTLTHNELQYMTGLLTMRNIVSGTNVPGFATWSKIRNDIADINPNITVKYSFGYYSSHTVCLPTLFPDRREDQAWGYSLFLLLVNFFSFIFMLATYVILYRRATNTNAAATSSSGQARRNSQNKRMQRKLTRILISDFLCWMPICLMGFMKLGGVSIPMDAYLPAGLLIIPINSALNPLLYSDLPDIVWERLAAIKKSQKPNKADKTKRQEGSEPGDSAKQISKQTELTGTEMTKSVSNHEVEPKGEERINRDGGIELETNIQ